MLQQLQLGRLVEAHIEVVMTGGSTLVRQLLCVLAVLFYVLHVWWL
jgi:hypothetical protein